MPGKAAKPTLAAQNWDDFRRLWSGTQNVVLKDACVPFSFRMPPVEEVVDAVRGVPEARLYLGGVAEPVVDARREAFVDAPIEEAMDTCFSLALFKLDRLFGQGELLEGFEDQVMEPWRDALSAAGFTWRRCYPILFISGKGSDTRYHMDNSHVVAWQMEGVKRFCWLREPEKWAPKALRLTDRHPPMPEGLEEEDTICFDMHPGDVLWNQLLTPHWVEAPADRATYSFNISHGGVRLNGELCPFEKELLAHQQAQGITPF